MIQPSIASLSSWSGKSGPLWPQLLLAWSCLPSKTCTPPLTSPMMSSMVCLKLASTLLMICLRTSWISSSTRLSSKTSELPTLMMTSLKSTLHLLVHYEGRQKCLRIAIKLNIPFVKGSCNLEISSLNTLTSINNLLVCLKLNQSFMKLDFSRSTCLSTRYQVHWRGIRVVPCVYRRRKWGSA